MNNSKNTQTQNHINVLHNVYGREKSKLLQAAREAADAQKMQPPEVGFDFSEFELCKTKRQVLTKLGLAFQKGDITIAKKETLPEMGEVATAWSIRNGIATSVRLGWIEFL